MDWIMEVSKYSILRALFHIQLLLLLIGPLDISAQLDASAIRQAVQNGQCEEIEGQLEQAVLSTEEAYFFAGICWYQLEEQAEAIAHFEQVAMSNSRLKNRAIHWLARCHANERNDSLAMEYLSQLPSTFLNFKLLSLPEFDHLAESNQAFTRLLEASRPGFNFWTRVLAMITALGFLLGFLLLGSRSNFTSGHQWLALLLFSSSTILSSYLLYWTGYNLYFPYLNSWWYFLSYLIGPSIFFYLQSVFKADFGYREVALHFLVPVSVFLLTLPANLLAFGIQTGLPGALFVIGTSSEMLIAHLVLYTLLVRALLNNDWQADDNIYTWSTILYRGFIAYTLAFLSYFILSETSFFSPRWDYAISLIMSIGILVIAYMGFIQRQIFSSKPIENYLPVKKYQNSMLTSSAAASVRRKITHLLKEEKVFKENELRLDDLAAYIDIPRHQLSQVINESYGVNFFELINTFRVEHVKQLLADEQYEHYTILQIAFESGFNNKASFNRYFKKSTGLTPSAYRLKAGNKESQKPSKS
jgi:AraC-like DNA-binding protein